MNAFAMVAKCAERQPIYDASDCHRCGASISTQRWYCVLCEIRELDKEAQEAGHSVCWRVSP